MNLKRELEILEKLQNDNIKFTLITYGNKMDLEFTEVNEKFEIIPIYNHVKYFDKKILRFIIFNTFKIKTFSKIKIIKQNQLNGAWISII